MKVGDYVKCVQASEDGFYGTKGDIYAVDAVEDVDGEGWAFAIRISGMAPTEPYVDPKRFEVVPPPEKTAPEPSEWPKGISPPNRKSQPVFDGVLMYFPDALKAIAEHSKRGNDKHNPGQKMHWAREKSGDQADCIARHLIDIGPTWDAKDPETGSYHATALAWRALALLQLVIEKEKTNGHG